MPLAGGISMPLAGGDSMPLWEAALLGLVQGLTEFLPVSSDGHLVIAQTLLGSNPEGLLFEIAVHVGTLLAILVFYRMKVLELIRGVLGRNEDSFRYVGKLALATLPAVGVGLFLRDTVEESFDAPWTAGVGLLITGTFLATTRFTQGTAKGLEPGWSQAFVIGCAQALAIGPGVSRSGLTLAVALAFGVAPLAAAEFSFLMGIIAITGAAVLMLPDAIGAPADALRPLWVGAAVAAVSGLAALALLVQLLRRRRFHWFAGYTWAAGLCFLAFLAVR
jgi:undecaprenyl-diphosphatase